MPFAAPFVSPSAAGLHVPERRLDGELASGTPRAMRRRRALVRGEGGGVAGVGDGRRGATASTSTTVWLEESLTPEAKAKRRASPRLAYRRPLRPGSRWAEPRTQAPAHRKDASRATPHSALVVMVAWSRPPRVAALRVCAGVGPPPWAGSRAGRGERRPAAGREDQARHREKHHAGRLRDGQRRAVEASANATVAEVCAGPATAGRPHRVTPCLGSPCYEEESPVAGGPPSSVDGLTRVILTSESVLPPLINAGEVFGLFPIGNLTITRDSLALESVKRSLQNIPDDWTGDPCMPHGYAWTGVTCHEGQNIRVISLNFSSMGISGSLSPDIANLTALTDISFANNSLSGPIPDLTKLSKLQRLHLHDNKLNGTIPQTLGRIQALRELSLQNNELSGAVPQNLLNNPGLTSQFRPGNHFNPQPPR